MKRIKPGLLSVIVESASRMMPANESLISTIQPSKAAQALVWHRHSALCNYIMAILGLKAKSVSVQPSRLRFLLCDNWTDETLMCSEKQALLRLAAYQPEANRFTADFSPQ